MCSCIIYHARCGYHSWLASTKHAVGWLEAGWVLMCRRVSTYIPQSSPLPRTGSVTDHPSLFGPSTSLAFVPTYLSSHWSCRACTPARPHASLAYQFQMVRARGQTREKSTGAMPAFRDTVDPGSQPSVSRNGKIPGCHGHGRLLASRPSSLRPLPISRSTREVLGPGISIRGLQATNRANPSH
jgi:hypothetical protein